MSPMPGIFVIDDVIVLFIRPAIANVWPLRSSSSVDVRRVISAGMRNPCSWMPLAKSSVLTSGGPSGECGRRSTVGVKFRRTPNSLNSIVMRVAAARLGDGNRELAAGEEAGFLAAFGNQVRLGQALEQAARLQRLDQHAQVIASR